MKITGDHGNENALESVLNSDDVCLRQILAGLPQSARSLTEQSDAFWKRQQNQISRRIATSIRRPERPTLAWASVLALALLAMLFLNGRPPSPSLTENDSDQELLVAVERAMQTEGPEALSPAALLADEIVGSAQPASKPSNVYKENQNESQ